MDGNTLREGLNFFYVLKLSIGKSYYQGGHNIWLKLLWPSARILLKTSSHLHQDSQLNHSQFLLIWWVRQCALKWPLQTEGIYTFHVLPIVHFFFSNGSLDTRLTRAFSLFLHWHTLSSQATSLISPSILERKGGKTQLEREQLHWFLISKEHLVYVLAASCVCYSWSFAPSRLERHPVSLPILWQSRKVCNHPLQRVKLPLTSRAHPLDLRTR
jgi:hypothetical protein